MKLDNSKQTIISLAVVSSLALNTVGTTVFAIDNSSEKDTKETTAEKKTQGKEDYTKNENVYAKLKGDGSIKDVQVVNVFDIKEGTTVTDYGTYKSVANLSSLDKLNYENNQVSFQGEEGKFYYQGAYELELPWNVEIEYYLDGEKISPESLGGASGQVKIHIRTSKNSKLDKGFYENYLMQISLTLDTNKFKEIKAEGGTIADAGESQNITFTVMPETDADYTVEARVEEFAMKGFTLAAIPFSMSIGSESFKTDEITSEMDKLTDAVKELNLGAQQLKDGMEELSSGGSSLKDGVSQLEDGLVKLDSNGQVLAGASSQINEALKTISSKLAAGDMSGLMEIKSLPVVLNQLGSALKEIQGGMGELYNGFIAAYGALDETIKGSVNTLSKEEIEALQGAMASSAGDPVAMSMYQKLMKSYEDVQRIQGVYEVIKPVFQALETSLNPNPVAGMENASLAYGIGQVLGGLNQMSQQLSASLSQVDIEGTMKELQEGLGTLAESYNEFHGGLTQYTEGVKAVKDGCGELSKGVNLYTDGVKQAGEGTTALAEGTKEFEEGTKDMPETMQDTIDEMISKYSGGDYKAVSFVDSRNTSIGSVQFIISTEEIKAPVVEKVQEEEVKLGFWDRLINLFKN